MAGFPPTTPRAAGARKRVVPRRSVRLTIPRSDQKQENDRSLMKRHRRPVGRVGQVVFQVQSGVSNGFFKECGTMLVIAVQAVMSELPYPKPRQLTDE